MAIEEQRQGQIENEEKKLKEKGIAKYCPLNMYVYS